MNQEELLNRSEQLASEYGIETQEDFNDLAKTNPEKASEFIQKASELMSEKVVGKSFEEMTEEDMVALQGAGDVKAETTPVCFLGGLGVGIVYSCLNCS